MRRAIIIALGSALIVAGLPAPVSAHGYGYYGNRHYRPYYPARYAYGSWYRHWPAYSYYHAYPTLYAPWPAAPVAFIDTDVRPEKAEVFLNDRYIGVADRFDGFPGYLTLSPGNHTIEFRYEGKRSERRDIAVGPGSFIRFDFKMLPAGDAPAAQESVIDSVPEPAEPGFVRLRITPDDASVYIDDGLYGTAATLAGLHGDMRLPAGEHIIEIVRPGYNTALRTLHLQSGEHVTLAVSLEKRDE